MIRVDNLLNMPISHKNFFNDLIVSKKNIVVERSPDHACLFVFDCFLIFSSLSGKVNKQNQLRVCPFRNAALISFVSMIKCPQKPICRASRVFWVYSQREATVFLITTKMAAVATRRRLGRKLWLVLASSGQVF